MIVRLIVRPSWKSSLRTLAAAQHVERERITEDLRESYAQALRMRLLAQESIDRQREQRAMGNLRRTTE